MPSSRSCSSPTAIYCIFKDMCPHPLIKNSSPASLRNLSFQRSALRKGFRRRVCYGVEVFELGVSEAVVSHQLCQPVAEPPRAASTGFRGRASIVTGSAGRRLAGPCASPVAPDCIADSWHQHGSGVDCLRNCAGIDPRGRLVDRRRYGAHRGRRRPYGNCYSGIGRRRIWRLTVVVSRVAGSSGVG